ncbi:hypothetical protein JCM10212_001478, partial [Sporobolomyces blumeae]
MSCLATPLRFLPVLPQELQLATVLKSGQSFRWHRSSPPAATRPDPAPPRSETLNPDSLDPDADEWSLGWGERTVVLRQDEYGVYYRSLYPFRPPHDAFAADLANDTTRSLLVDYFQLDTPLAPLYETWRTNDAKFDKKIRDDAKGRLEGIRVLNQPEWETVVSFICSANNNIPRITLMVNRLCAHLGTPLPHPSHFDPSSVHYSPSTIPMSTCPSSPSARAPQNDLSLYSFPPPESLVDSTTESVLRQLGFGYRANFVPSSAALVLETASNLSLSPDEYLRSLRKGTFEGTIDDARAELLKLKGVGRKVADCILLFGLGWSETVPVDTHVFQ